MTRIAKLICLEEDEVLNRIVQVVGMGLDACKALGKLPDTDERRQKIIDRATAVANDLQDTVQKYDGERPAVILLAVISMLCALQRSVYSSLLEFLQQPKPK